MSHLNGYSSYVANGERSKSLIYTVTPYKVNKEIIKLDLFYTFSPSFFNTKQSILVVSEKEQDLGFCDDISLIRISV